ncbi:MAG: hypothetical protein JKY12_06990, partial [Sneathiella sp.]|nr:hypothetical protein [Sneathiella sp.]
MINSVGGNNPVYSAQSVSQAYGNAPSVENNKQSASYDDAVQVELSEGAKTVKETLDGFPPLSLD